MWQRGIEGGGSNPTCVCMRQKHCLAGRSGQEGELIAVLQARLMARDVKGEVGGCG